MKKGIYVVQIRVACIWSKYEWIYGNGTK